MSDRLTDWLGSVSNDPLAFVMGAFPWHEPGTILETEDGPEAWQREVLCHLRDGLITIDQALRVAVASGHGVGKSTLVAWIILWVISTMPDSKGVVTANTENQLKTKTWSELGKWHRLFIGNVLFKLTATALFQIDRERTWRIDMIPWSEKNTEAFQGLHNKGRRLLLVFDEGSAIPDKIWDVAEGAMTDADTQIIWCVFGNPTRNSGRFRECWGRFGPQWWKKQVDSRTVRFTNKKQITEWSSTYGDDSDFFRVRVKGEFPRQGELEFFSAVDIDAAMLREPEVQQTDPLALGVDVARFGSNFSVIYPRKGRDARTLARESYQGLDTVLLAQRVFTLQEKLRADGIFVDGGGVGGGVVDNLRHMHLHCFEVQFGGKAQGLGYATATQGEAYANKRAEMYGSLRGWLKTGSIPNDPALRQQFLSITYTLNIRDEIVLTSKEVMMREGKDSPDDLDALALTFALPLASHATAGGEHAPKSLVQTEYDPFDPKYMEAA